MNKTILILAVFAAIPAFAQSTASQPAQPPAANSQAAFAPAGPGLPGGPANPGLPAAPANSGLPGFANPPFANATARPGFTNQFGTNGFPADLGPLLAILQNDIQQVLPALAAYNATVASGAADESLTSTGAISGPVSPPPSTTGANFSSSSGVNFSKRLGVNSGVNLSSPAGGVPPASSNPNNPSLAAGGPVGFGLSPTGTTNSSGLSPAFESSAVPNSLDQAAVARDTLRELLVLQSDIQRLLPLVNTFSGSNAPGPTPASFTNNFAAPGNPPFAGSTNQNRTLTPTGRR